VNPLNKKNRNLLKKLEKEVQDIKNTGTCERWEAKMSAATNGAKKVNPADVAEASKKASANKQQQEAQEEREKRQSEARMLKEQAWMESQGWETAGTQGKIKNAARSRGGAAQQKL